MFRVTLLTLLGLAAGLCPLQAQPIVEGRPVSLYGVQQATTPIRIDGRIDEFAWQQAAQINDFYRILNHYDPITAPTRARMLWDADHFYFAFACTDPDIWAIFAQEDDPMWSEEVVEVFIDPDGDGRNYLELEVNPLNAVVDLLIGAVEPEWTSSKDWDIAGLKTAVHVQGTVNDASDTDIGWSVEIAIPWTAFADGVDGGQRPAVGDTWRLNLYRIERRAGRQARARLVELNRQLEGLQKKHASADSVTLAARLEPLRTTMRPLGQAYNDQTEYTAWSETFRRGFHHPARFGQVQFLE